MLELYGREWFYAISVHDVERAQHSFPRQADMDFDSIQWLSTAVDAETSFTPSELVPPKINIQYLYEQSKQERDRGHVAVSFVLETQPRRVCVWSLDKVIDSPVRDGEVAIINKPTCLNAAREEPPPVAPNPTKAAYVSSPTTSEDSLPGPGRLASRNWNSGSWYGLKPISRAKNAPSDDSVFSDAVNGTYDGAEDSSASSMASSLASERDSDSDSGHDPLPPYRIFSLALGDVEGESITVWERLRCKMYNIAVHKSKRSKVVDPANMRNTTPAPPRCSAMLNLRLIDKGPNWRISKLDWKHNHDSDPVVYFDDEAERKPSQPTQAEKDLIRGLVVGGMGKLNRSQALQVVRVVIPGTNL
ncbi:unnamed protein product, partial [Tilletia caries]